MRIIKIVTPNNEVVSLEVSGEESEIKELLSALTGISASEIKGIKDKYGNYFTMSFAVKSNSITSDFSEIYYLVCSNSKFNAKNKKRQPSSNNSFNEDYYEEPIRNPYINYNKSVDNYNYRSKHGKHSNKRDSLKSIKNNYNNNNHIRPYSLTNDNILKSHDQGMYRYKKDKNYNYNMNTMDNFSSFNPNYLNSMNCNNNNFNYNIVIKELLDLHLIDNFKLNIIKNLINKDNPEITSLLNVYLQGFMSIETLSENINNLILNISGNTQYSQQFQSQGFNLTQPKVSSSKNIGKVGLGNLNNISNNQYTKFPVNNLSLDSLKNINSINSLNNNLGNTTLDKNVQLINLEKIYKNFFDDVNDLILIRQLYEFDNEYIKLAFESYQINFNIEELVNTLVGIISIYKKSNGINNLNNNSICSTPNQQQVINYSNNTISASPAHNSNINTLNSMNSNLNYNQNHNSQLSNSHIQTFGNQPMQNTPITFSNNNIATGNTSTIPANKKSSIQNTGSVNNSNSNVNTNINNDTTIGFSEQEVKKYSDQLHTEDKVIFKYALAKKVKDLQAVFFLHKSLKNDDLVLKSIKSFCQKFVEENITYAFTDDERSTYSELLREKNEETRNILKKLLDHKDINILKQELTMHIHSRQSSNNNFKNSSNSNSNANTNNTTEIKKTKLKKESKKAPIQQINLFGGLSPLGKTETNNNTVSQDENDNDQDEQEEQEQENEQEGEGEDADGDDGENKSEVDGSEEEEEEGEEEEDEQEEKGDRTNEFLSLVKHQTWLKDFEKQMIFELVKKDTWEGRRIVEEFDKNNNILMLKNKIKKLLKKEMENKLISPTISKSNYVNIVDDLKNKNIINIGEYNFIKTHLNKKDDNVINIFQLYEKNENDKELVQALKLFHNKRSRIFQGDKTPVQFTKGGKEYIDYFKTQKIIEKEEIKKKQLYVIDMLSKENMLDSDHATLVKQMIENENQIIISAFEIFSVTKDHWEFCETISIFTETYKQHEGEQEEKSEELPVAQQMTIEDYFPEIKKNGFTNQEISILNTQLAEKQKMLVGSLESYAKNKDVDDLIETLKLIAKKFMK
jgi:hypothetical protein